MLLLVSHVQTIEDAGTAKIEHLDVLNVSYSEGKRDTASFGGHGYWYKNPWVSSEVLATLRFRLTPGERGLEWHEEKLEWYFPQDYPRRVIDAIITSLPPESLEEMEKAKRAPKVTLRDAP